MQRADSFEKTLMLERMKVGGEGDDRGWDGWMASPTQWTWFWVNSGSWWWTGRPDVLQSMGLQRVGHNWATELRLNLIFFCKLIGYLYSFLLYIFCSYRLAVLLIWKSSISMIDNDNFHRKWNYKLLVSETWNFSKRWLIDYFFSTV